MAKRRVWRTFCSAALLCVAVPTLCQTEAHVPAMHGTTLAGEQVTFPDALKTKVNVLVIGFSHSSQEQIANWGRLINADYGKAQDVQYFELAMLAGAPRMLRGVIIKRMTSSVPFDQRPHYIPVLESDGPWRPVAHYNKADDAYVLLVDKAGLVLWRTEGDATDVAYAELRKQIQKLLAAVEAHGRAAPE